MKSCAIISQSGTVNSSTDISRAVMCALKLGCNNFIFGLDTHAEKLFAHKILTLKSRKNISLEAILPSITMLENITFRDILPLCDCISVYRPHLFGVTNLTRAEAMIKISDFIIFAPQLKNCTVFNNLILFARQENKKIYILN